jgi:hypothetical protein
MRSLSAMTKEPGLVAVGKILVVPTMPSQFQRLQIQIEITGHRPASSWPESAAALHPRLWAQFWSHSSPSGTVHWRSPGSCLRSSRTVADSGERWSALLASVLGATPQEFESPILRHVDLREHR